MKNFLLFSLLFISFHAFAQTQNTISEEFVISINNPENKIPEYAEIDVQDLNFSSKEDLEKFCKSFSINFHTLSPNWEQKIVRIKFQTEKLNAQKQTLNSVNDYFNKLSYRMNVIFDSL